MNIRIINFVKYNKFILYIYKKVFNSILYPMKKVCRIKYNRILFVSFGGRKYDDSPRAIYEYMRNDSFFKDYELLWAFINPNDFSQYNIKSIKIDTLKFYYFAITSRIWITNSSIQRGLNLKRNETFKINTWHGTPLKKMGDDIESKKVYYHKNKLSNVIYCCQSIYDQNIFSRLFNTGKDNIIVSDLPRNDSLLKYTQEDKIRILNALGIDSEKTIILYAPTFREYDRNSTNSCFICPPINIEKWKSKLGKKYIILFRAHYEVVNILGIKESDFVINVSNYPCLNDLMYISDMLISDYSSIYFDYSILEKPMFNFSYDLNTYKRFRGLYMNLDEELPCKINKNEDDLLNEISSYDESLYIEKTKKFKNKYCPHAGNATNLVVSIIKSKIMEEL